MNTFPRKQSKQQDRARHIAHDGVQFVLSTNLPDDNNLYFDNSNSKMASRTPTFLKDHNRNNMDIEPDPRILQLQLALAEALETNDKLEGEVRNYQSLLVAAGELNQSLQTRVSQLESKLNGQDKSQGRPSRKYSL